jgi:hypothetical protein
MIHRWNIYHILFRTARTYWRTPSESTLCAVLRDGVRLGPPALDMMSQEPCFLKYSFLNQNSLRVCRLIRSGIPRLTIYAGLSRLGERSDQARIQDLVIARSWRLDTRRLDARPMRGDLPPTGERSEQSSRGHPLKTSQKSLNKTIPRSTRVCHQVDTGTAPRPLTPPSASSPRCPWPEGGR